MPANWTPEVWAKYTDRFGFIHDKEVPKPEPEQPPSGNGLLYTAEACVIMTLSKVSYEKQKKDIREGLKKSQVPGKEGLFGRGPTKLNDQLGPDDYWGLGALAGICEFRDIAQKILKYGIGSDQRAGPKVLEKISFGPIRDQLKKCQTIVPYNYNNVNPGTYSPHSWMGAHPDLITHLKLAAGDQPPRVEELAYWAAALVFSGKQEDVGIPKKDKMGSWLLTWLQVLTYQLAEHHSTVADNAVAEWWKILEQKFPKGGIKQVMTQYLAGRAEHPLAKYISNFDDWRHPHPRLVDAGTHVGFPLGALGKFVTRKGVDYKKFSPKDFIGPFEKRANDSKPLLTAAEKALAKPKDLFERQEGVVKKINANIAAIRDAISRFESEKKRLEDDLKKGRLRDPRKLKRRIEELLREINKHRAQLNAPLKDLQEQTKILDKLRKELKPVQDIFDKAKRVFDEAEASRLFGEAVVRHLIPCFDPR